MPQRYIRTVMETITPQASEILSDADVTELWLNRQRSPLTRSVYRRDISRLLRSTGRALIETSALDLERFAEALAGSGLAPISQGRTLAASRSFFRFAERIGYCRNAAAGLELPRPEPALSERIIPQEDVRRMIALEPAERHRVLLAVLYAAGLRVSEACNLRWRNLQTRADGGRILIHGKAGVRASSRCHPACGPVRVPEGHSGHGRASLRVTFGKAAGAFARDADRSGCQPTGRDSRRREHALAQSRPFVDIVRARLRSEGVFQTARHDAGHRGLRLHPSAILYYQAPRP